MVGISEISAGFSSLKAAKDIIQGLTALQNQAALNEVKIELQGHILEAQGALFAAKEAYAEVAEREAELRAELDRLRDWSAERSKYELRQIDNSAFAYMEREGVNSGEPPHWLCVNCFDAGHKSIMQPSGTERSARGGADTIYGCARCKNHVSIFSRRRPEVPYTLKAE